MQPQTDESGSQKPSNEERFVGITDVYLPHPDSWYPFNLRYCHTESPDENRMKGYYGDALRPVVSGGTIIHWNGAINYDTTRDNESDPQHLPYVTAMYVRAGGIIPQMDLHYYVPGKDVKPDEQNHITIHVYPGKDNVRFPQN